MMIEKGQIVELVINDMTEDGKGISRKDGLVIFCEGALPGDLVEAKITKVKKNFAIAKVKNIIEQSENRIENDCPYFRKCGGCSLREYNYNAQCKLKENQVRNKLERIGKIKNPKINNIIACSDDKNLERGAYRYRNKAVFTVTVDGKVGFKKRGSNDVIDCIDCLLQKNVTMIIAQAVRYLINKKEISVYDNKSKQGELVSFTVKVCEGTKEVMIIFSVDGKKFSNIEKIITFINNEINNSAKCYDDYFLASVILETEKKEYKVIAGGKTIRDTVNISKDFNFEISAPAFYQVNTNQMIKLYSKIIEYANLKGNEIIYDLYCGIGTIGLCMSDKVKFVAGIESVHSAVLDANRNAVINRVVNAVYKTGKSEEILFDFCKELDEKGFSENKIAVVDPPRNGCAFELLKSIAESDMDKIIYVSCNPATLARDIKVLMDFGYFFIEATPVDMFPWTMHVECVCLLSKN